MTTTPLSDRPTIGVVGAGFSGLLTALHLLDSPERPRVRLIERRPSFARGAAYSTRNAEHLLNVRASNMSAFPEEPSHFLDWLCAQGQSEEGSVFATRARYGAYLQAVLRDAAEHGEPGRLLLEADAALGLERRGAGLRLTTGMGRSFDLDAAVLAVGNLPPHAPPGFGPEAAASPAFLAEPWAYDVDALPEEGCAVIVGSGLTMVDVALQLARERPGLRLLALSRRGVLPRRHLAHGPAPEPFEPQAPQAVLSLLRELRRRSAGKDWRTVVDGLRPHVQSVWRGWSLEERRRFLRHARPLWDSHRHRLAPDVASRLDHLTASGVLRLAAGRLVEARPNGEGLDVLWRGRGQAEVQTTRAALVVNCTGPGGDLARTRDPLLRGLAERGLVRPDACALGLDVDPQGRLLDRSGRPQESLFAIGPLTRGAAWEMTSVPDIRVQAKTVARAAAAAAARAASAAAVGS